jgi:DNA repair exonuclease SbcCD ATPase subunit
MGTRHWPEDADDYVEELEQQLAKANERIKELDNKINQSYDAFIKGVELGVFYNGENALKKFAIEKKIEAFENAQIPQHAKAGCIGEFNFIIEDGECCPECWQEQDDNCHMCNGNSDESGLSDLTATVPWDLCKEIWLRMNKIYAEQLRKEQEND